MSSLNWNNETLHVEVNGHVADAPFECMDQNEGQQQICFGDAASRRGVRVWLHVVPNFSGRGMQIKAGAIHDNYYDGRFQWPVEAVFDRPDLNVPPRPGQEEAYREAVLTAGNTALYGITSLTMGR